MRRAENLKVYQEPKVIFLTSQVYETLTKQRQEALRMGRKGC